MRHETHPVNEPCCCQCGSSAHPCGECRPKRREVSADEVIRRENLSKPTRDYPGAEQMAAWQRLK